MGEVKFVLKCLLVTCLIVVAMQIRISGRSIESQTFRWLRYSEVSKYVQGVAAGGVMALRRLTNSVGDGISNTIDGFQEGQHEKAIR